ncbi:flavodoxin [Sporomusa ovata DSM 2662]|uniref:Flavodoxin n=1 Tax=Sporomusa ovata TaxID=2378 RepID=A0A0U1L1I0_9FIRM|nr:flavodoxin family protein [Sporomusa ovata]EQB27821.1 flavodoxin family protein [Sporomusa ovata DSM 2662]CQR72754.1 Flavodoxin [Sporomusa ovata]
MKTLIVYSSLTGNTRKVAEAVQEVFGKEAYIFPVEEKPPADGYDLVAVGFWVDRGTADKKAQEYITGLCNQKVALFATLGAYPDSEHARQSMANAVALIDDSNQFIGSFICQGKIDPKLVEQFKKLPESHPHAMNPERAARHQEAAKHPDENDLANAKRVFAEFRQNLHTGGL